MIEASEDDERSPVSHEDREGTRAKLFAPSDCDISVRLTTRAFHGRRWLAGHWVSSYSNSLQHGRLRWTDLSEMSV